MELAPDHRMFIKGHNAMNQDILIFSSRITHAERVHTALNKHGISATIVSDANEAMDLLAAHAPAFFWLDIDTEDAQSFLQDIMDRALHPPPYIILSSAFADSAARAVMLDQGADTCIEIPVDVNEILSVLNAVLRREKRLNGFYTKRLLPCIKHKELFIDPLRRQVKMRGKEIHLTSKEYELLFLLANNPGTAFSKGELYSRVWKTESDMGITTVTDHISSLRQKLGLHSKDKNYIQTVFGVGYRFNKPD